MTSNEDKTPNTRIKYLDGHTDEVCVTMWQRCHAYSAYVRCRQIGVTTLPFEQWADTVVSVEDMNNDPVDTEPAESYSGDVLQSMSGDDAPGFLTNGTQAASAN